MMTDDYMKRLTRQLTLGSRRCAKRIVKEEGQPDRKELFLTTLSNLTDVQYMHPSNFVEELTAAGLEIDPATLQILELKEEAQTPAPDTVQPAPTVPPTPELAPVPDPAPSIPPVWTDTELVAMSYKELRAAAKIDPVVPGNVSTDEMRRQLLGRPKSFG